MNIKYTILISTLVLTACGTDTETQTSATQQAAPISPSQVVQKTDTGERSMSQVSTNASSTVQADNSQVENTQTEKTNIELPLGRLMGIIDTSEYKQAIINNQGQITRLKEGDDWQGWRVTTIDQEQLVISRNGKDHSLNLLSEFRSPQLTETELTNRNLNDKAEKEKIESTTEKPFTEEQLTELRSRLLMGRE